MKIIKIKSGQQFVCILQRFEQLQKQYQTVKPNVDDRNQFKVKQRWNQSNLIIPMQSQRLIQVVQVIVHS